jgi:hypothetical protein
VSEEDIAAALRDVLAEVDRIPEAALSAARDAIGWRRLDAELAQLTGETEPALTRLRGGQPRLMAFRSGDMIIELELSSAAGVARLLGQLEPPGEAEVSAESPAGSLTTRADGQGRFSFDGLAAGWMRIVVAPMPGKGTRTATEWFRA